MDSMLLCCGETGYRRVAVEQVFRRLGGYRSQFYRYFENKEKCFEAAYAEQVERLCGTLLSHRGEPEGLSRALTALGRYVSDQPTRAKAMFVEVHVAGGGALAKRREIMERLARALDSACRHNGSSHPPPPMTAEFMICAVEQAVSSALVRGRPDEFAATVPELVELISQTYRDAS
ncbi:MAG: TetR/AcrR family transcriptional regulator [Solirubrobacterales bacterium]